MYQGLAFKHVQAGGGNGLVFQGHGQRRVIHNAAARNVDQRGGGLHQRQFGCTDGVVGRRRIRQHQHQVVSGFQQLVLADIARFALGFQRGIKARTVVINDLHAKAERATPGNALADAAHAQNAQCGAVNVSTGKHVKAPLGPLAGTQKVFAFGDAAGGGHHQRKAKVGGGFGQHIGRVGGQHAGRRHGVNVKVVVAHRHVGADFQVRAGGQHLGVNAVTTGGESSLLALKALGQLSFGPDRVGLVGFNIKVL